MARNNKHYKWKGINDLSFSYFYNIQSNAYKRNIIFNLTINDIYKQLEIQNRKCNLSNHNLILKEYNLDKNDNASLDRIDSSVGYVINNIQWTHKIINNMKWDLNQDYFVKLCNLVTYPIEENRNHILDFKNKHHNYKGIGPLSSRFFSAIKIAAKRRDIEFSITIEDCWQQFLKQKGKCYFTKQNLIFSQNSKNKSETTASVDRLDNNIGYLVNNIIFVHKDINSMKISLSEIEFKFWCREVTNVKL